MLVLEGYLKKQCSNGKEHANRGYMLVYSGAPSVDA